MGILPTPPAIDNGPLLSQFLGCFPELHSMMRSMRFTYSPNEFGSYNSPEAEDKTLIKLKRVGNVEARRENGLGKQHSFRLTEVGDQLPQPECRQP
jgi:hypothetical protein